MCTLAATLALIAQSYNPDPALHPTLDSLSDMMEQQSAMAADKAARERARAFEERQFVEKFNDLLVALKAFSVKYNTQHVLDVRAVESVKKAYRRLEKADPWFRIKDDQR